MAENTVFVPDDWDDDEFEMYDDLLRGEAISVHEMNDAHLQDLFDAALFARRRDGEEGYKLGDEYQALLDYLDNELGIDFERDFDWDHYREWYDSQ